MVLWVSVIITEQCQGNLRVRPYQLYSLVLLALGHPAFALPQARPVHSFRETTASPTHVVANLVQQYKNVLAIETSFFKVNSHRWASSRQVFPLDDKANIPVFLHEVPDRSPLESDHPAADILQHPARFGCWAGDL